METKDQRMAADHLTGIEQFEADLWKVADNLRANSNLASNEYFMPILGLICLRQVTNRYYAARREIERDMAAGRMPRRPLIDADFSRRRAMNLPEAARYDVFLESRKDGTLGAAVTAAMEAMEARFPPLAGQLPKDYGRFEDDVLESMMDASAPKRCDPHRATSSAASTSTSSSSSRRRKPTTTGSSSPRLRSSRPS